MKIWALKKLIAGCDWLLRNDQYADDESERNEVVSMRNYLLRELARLQGDTVRKSK